MCSTTAIIGAISPTSTTSSRAWSRRSTTSAAPDPALGFRLRPNPSTSNAPYRIYNIGNQQPVTLLRYIEVLEQCLGRKAQKNLLPMQPGDVPDTWADVAGAGARRRLPAAAPSSRRA